MSGLILSLLNIDLFLYDAVSLTIVIATWPITERLWIAAGLPRAYHKCKRSVAADAEKF